VGERDPVSVAMDPAARRFLAQARARRGSWAYTWLAPPSGRWYAWAAHRGIALMATDRWGERRWVRGFKRAVYHHARHAGEPVQWETISTGWKGTRIRIRILTSGQLARAAARRRGSYTADPSLRSTEADHDWEG
jgi:hypothetical protein